MIRRDISVLDPALAGNPVTVIVSVTLADRQTDAIAEFKALMSDRPEVRYCAMVAGSIDYIVHVSLKSVADYAAFSEDVFIGNRFIGSYESWIVLAEIKHETGIVLAD